MRYLAALLLLFAAPAAGQNIKPSQLPAASTLTGTELIVGSQGANCSGTGTSACSTVKISPAQIGTYLAPSFQPRDADLDAIAALTGTGIYWRSAANTWSPVAIGSNLTFSGGTLAATAGGTGTVTSFAFTNGAGVTGTVTSASTTPTLSLSLGAITPSSVATTGAISAASATLSNPLLVASGGTGSTTAASARTALGAAASGANTDINSITGSAAKLTIARTIAGSSFDGSANITIADTALTGAAWTTYTPAVTPTAGSFTSVSATGRYKQVGKTVCFRASITITNAGTAAQSFTFSLPVPADTTFPQLAAGRETAVVGSAATAQTTSANAMILLRYDNAALIGNGYVDVAQGCYEAS